MRPDARELASRVAAGETVVLRGQASALLLLLLGAAAFTAAGIAMTVGPLSSLPFGSSRWDSPFTVLFGLAAIGFFGGVGGSAAVHGLRHVRRALTIEAEGLRHHGGHLVPWQSVHGLLRTTSGKRGQGQLFVRIGHEGTRAWLSGVAPLSRWMHRFNRGKHPLPRTAGIRQADLWELLELARERAAQVRSRR